MSEKKTTDDYVVAALKDAQSYIDKYKEASQLKGATAEESATIKKFLESNPYKDMPATVKSMLEDATKGVKAAEGTRSVTYLSGATGSKNLLVAAANAEGAKGEAAELKKLLDNAVKSDFKTHKAQLSKYTKIDIAREPYGKWRPLLSGIDSTINAMARGNNLNVVLDNTIPNLDARDKPKVKLFAIALTSEESQAEAAKLGINAKESDRTLKEFHDAFADIKKTVPDITLLDSKMNIIFQQKNFKIEKLDLQKMQSWDKDNGVQKKHEPKSQLPDNFIPDTKGIPALPRAIGG